MASNTANATRSFGEFRPSNLPLATIGLSLATFMQVQDITIANVSLPTIAGNLGASLTQSTWSLPRLVREAVAATGGNRPLYAAEMNRVISQQAMQISFNQLFDALGFIFLGLVAVVWLAKPPFIKKSGRELDS